MGYRNSYEDLMEDIERSGQNWSVYDLELAKEDPDAGREIYTQKQAWANARTAEEKAAANAAAELIRKKYGGYAAGSDGSGYTPVSVDSVYSQPGVSTAPDYTAYESEYAGQIQDLVDQLGSREAFSYDPASDPSYQAYAEHYRNAGEQARKDTLARAAALVGGQASTYAVAAAQQAQNNYNAALSDAIPQLQGEAYDRYLDEGDALRGQLSTLLTLDDLAYERHQDDWSNRFNQWQADYAVGRDALEDSRYEEKQKAKVITDPGNGNETSPMTEAEYNAFMRGVKEYISAGLPGRLMEHVTANVDKLTDEQYETVLSILKNLPSTWTQTWR